LIATGKTCPVTRHDLEAVAQRHHQDVVAADRQKQHQRHEILELAHQRRLLVESGVYHLRNAESHVPPEHFAREARRHEDEARDHPDQQPHRGLPHDEHRQVRPRPRDRRVRARHQRHERQRHEEPEPDLDPWVHRAVAEHRRDEAQAQHAEENQREKLHVSCEHRVELHA
jgi:hypothetical protein